MMQIVLKSYGYYEGKIDGFLVKCIKKSINFISKKIILMQMELIGPQTCTLLLNKQNIVKNIQITKNISKEVTKDNTYSQEIYDAQIILKELDLYIYY